MDKVEVDPTLRRMIEIYLRVGIWRNDGESDYRKSWMRILYFFQYFSFVVFVLTSIYHAYLSKDTNQIIFFVDVEIQTLIIMVKSFYLLWRKDEITKFLYDAHMTHCHTKDYSESAIVNQKIGKFAIINKVYFSVLISC